MAAQDGIGHPVTERVQVLPSIGLLNAQGAVDAVQFYHCRLEVVRHAHDALGADDVCICIVSLLLGQLPVDEALGDVVGHAVLECAVALQPPGILVVPHPHSLCVPGLVFAPGIPACDVYIVHPAIMECGPFVFVPFAGG